MFWYNANKVKLVVYLNKIVLEEIERIVNESNIMDCLDNDWPHPNKIGKQELDIRIGSDEINFRTSKIGSYSEVLKSKGKVFLEYIFEDLINY